MAYRDTDCTVESGTLFCFAIEGEASGKRFACVQASDEETAQVRMAPLFPDCVLTPVNPASVQGIRR